MDRFQEFYMKKATTSRTNANSAMATPETIQKVNTERKNVKKVILSNF